MQGKILPSWDEVIEDEDSHDGNLLFDWAFSQTRVINYNVIIDLGKNEIMHDVNNQKDYVCDQHRPTDFSKVWKSWVLFIDNQSTCDVIINRKLLNNIKKDRWNFKLQDQVGD